MVHSTSLHAPYVSFLHDPGTVGKDVWTYEQLDPPLSTEEFYLSSFGLPEPNFGTSWYRGAWVVYLVGGAACVGIAYWFRRKRLMVA